LGTRQGILLQKTILRAHSWPQKVTTVVPSYGHSPSCTKGQLEQLLEEVQQVGGKEEGHSIFLDQHRHHHFFSPSNRLLMFLQSPLQPNAWRFVSFIRCGLEQPESSSSGFSHEFVDGGANKQPSSSGRNLLFRSLCYCFMYASLSMTWV
jgi:hypothetical protein